jgi:hypothetical protein
MIQDEVGFLCLPPAFAAVPQYFIHITVALLSLSEPDKQLSHIRLPDKSFSTIPLFETDSNPSGFSQWASLRRQGPVRSLPRCMPCVGSCG